MHGKGSEADLTRKRGPENVAAKAASKTPKYSSTPSGKLHSMKFLARSIA
jgi:hypothetical protein